MARKSEGGEGKAVGRTFCTALSSALDEWCNSAPRGLQTMRMFLPHLAFVMFLVAVMLFKGKKLLLDQHPSLIVAARPIRQFVPMPSSKLQAGESVLETNTASPLNVSTAKRVQMARPHLRNMSNTDLKALFVQTLSRNQKAGQGETSAVQADAKEGSGVQWSSVDRCSLGRDIFQATSLLLPKSPHCGVPPLQSITYLVTTDIFTEKLQALCKKTAQVPSSVHPSSKDATSQPEHSIPMDFVSLG